MVSVGWGAMRTVPGPTMGSECSSAMMTFRLPDEMMVSRRLLPMNCRDG